MIDTSIRIQVFDKFSFSTILPLNPTTTAEDISNIVSTKLGIEADEKIFYSLICLYSGISKTNGYVHRLKTIKPFEKLHDVVNIITNRQFDDEDINKETCTISWFYKDIRSPPLELDGETSGNSSSEDERDINLSDLLYFGSGERRGFLLKRSSHDVNLWRKRLCILNDKLWCINVNKRIPRASCIELDGNVFLQEEAARELQYPNGFIIQGKNHTPIFFRATSASEQHRWRDELQDKAAFTSENSIIKMAELIICGEEEAISCKRQNSVNMVLGTKALTHALATTFEARSRPLSNQASSFESASQGQGLSVLDDDTENAEEGYGGGGGYMYERGSAGGSTSPRAGTQPPSFIRESSLPYEPPCDSRRSDFFLHSFHEQYPYCASAISLVKAVNDYKSYFRHDLGYSSSDLWLFALQLYIHHILPHLASAGYIHSPSSYSPSPSAYKRSQSATPPSTPPSIKGKPHHLCSLPQSHDIDRDIVLSMDLVTKIHRKIFSFVIKKKKKVEGGALDRFKERNWKNRDVVRGRASEGTWSSWVWGTDAIPEAHNASAGFDRSGSNGANASSREAANTSSESVGSVFSDYEVIADAKEPEMHLFDELLNDVYQTLNDI